MSSQFLRRLRLPKFNFQNIDVDLAILKRGLTFWIRLKNSAKSRKQGKSTGVPSGRSDRLRRRRLPNVQVHVREGGWLPRAGDGEKGGNERSFEFRSSHLLGGNYWYKSLLGLRKKKTFKSFNPVFNKIHVSKMLLSFSIKTHKKGWVDIMKERSRIMSLTWMSFISVKRFRW